jgi:signal peptidase II
MARGAREAAAGRVHEGMRSDSSGQGHLPPPPTSPRTVATGLGTAALALSADQIIKLYLASHFSPNELICSGPYVSLVYVTNSGGVCGYAQGANQLLAIVGAATTLAIGLSLLFIPNSRIHAAAFGLLLAGAAGNLIDRIRLGHVIDFVSLDRFGWPAFNMADMLIVAGIVIVGLLFLRDSPNDRSRETSEAHTFRPALVVALIIAAGALGLGYVLCILRPFD